jgi:hypothetical protein
MGERVWRITWYVHLNGLCVKRSSIKEIHGDNHIRGVTSMHSTCHPPTLAYHLIGENLLSPRLLESHIPPGYAHAELLSGATVRLTFISPGCVSWAPGQHFLISIPSISRTTSHPFTVASVCDEQAPEKNGRAIIFLIRCKNGWTRRLWEYVGTNCSSGDYPSDGTFSPGNTMPRKGTLLKTFIDGPFGSTIRTCWGSHSTILIIVGGSGASFGLSLLEYACLCLSGRDGKHLGGKPGMRGQGFSTQRIRFVWLIREYGEWVVFYASRSSNMTATFSSHPMVRVCHPSVHGYATIA